MNSIPRNEYPRPQFQREEWINLNGTWDFTLDRAFYGLSKNYQNSTEFDGKILVPFCPESKLSGVQHTDFIPCIWYHRNLEIPAAWEGRKILLHFGGVDYETTVFLDGVAVERHTGGAGSFTVDLTGFAKPGQKHHLVLMVRDDTTSGIQPLGKQCHFSNSRGCSYTRVTGIWQTVWMEAVHPAALRTCRITPDFDGSAFIFQPAFYQDQAENRFAIVVKDGPQVVASIERPVGSGCPVVLQIPNPKPWTPDSPFLYDVEYTVTDKEGHILDKVSSYAGLRKIHLENGRYYLNNKPIFLRLVLDQGFYEDSLWTAPSDDALRQDILLSQKAGFNGARLHQKVFEERFHYWADRLGYLTWAEYPDWGIALWQHFRPAPDNYQLAARNVLPEWASIVERDYNHPSIITWTPTNETERIFNLDEHKHFLRDLYDLTKRLDSTRPVNDSSGYTHVKTDLWTVHIYQGGDVQKLNDSVNRQPVFMRYPEIEATAYHGQPYLIDEYGGISYLPEGRKPWKAGSWGYNKEKLTKEQSQERIDALTRTLVDNPRVAGYCYTQLTDIEQEQNGVYTYDRVPKFDEEKIRKTFSYKPDWSAF